MFVCESTGPRLIYDTQFPEPPCMVIHKCECGKINYIPLNEGVREILEEIDEEAN